MLGEGEFECDAYVLFGRGQNDDSVSLDVHNGEAVFTSQARTPAES